MLKFVHLDICRVKNANPVASVAALARSILCREASMRLRLALPTVSQSGALGLCIHLGGSSVAVSSEPGHLNYPLNVAVAKFSP
jgi:hypothetical protein